MKLCADFNTPLSSKAVLRYLHNGEVISGGLKQCRCQSPKAALLLCFHGLSARKIEKEPIKMICSNKEKRKSMGEGHAKGGEEKKDNNVAKRCNKMGKILNLSCNSGSHPFPVLHLLWFCLFCNQAVVCQNF